MAWSPFKPQKHGGQLVRRKQGQPIHRKSHSGGTGEEADRKLRRLQSGLKHWVSKEKVLEPEGGTQLVLKYFGPQVAGSWTHGWWGRRGESLFAVESSKKL